MIALLADHLWQSTLFALGAGLLTLPFSRNRAGVRYGLWLAASVKFLVPFALLAAVGGALGTRLHLTLVAPRAATAARSAGGLANWTPDLMAPATSFKILSPQVSASHALAVPFDHAPAFQIDPGPILLGAWVIGLAAILLAWAARWSRIRAALRDASPARLSVPVPALSTPAGLEPGVVGLWRPVLVLPEGIAERLSAAELDAVIAHELCHMRRRDNLTGAIHMLVQALFWFHPLVWWLGGRLIAERERACDEAVVSAGHDRETYARGLIETCRLYLHSPLACVAGASGSFLEQRVDGILSRPLAAPLALEARASIGMAGMLALTIPVAAGILAAPPIAQPLAVLALAVQTAALPARPPVAAQAATPPTVAPAPKAEPIASIAPAAPTVLAPQPRATITLASNAQTDVAWTPAEPPAPPVIPVAPRPAEAAASPVALETVTPAEIRRRAYDFARTFGATSVRLDQFARWTQPVCVTVQGLPTSAAAQVAGRVQEVAGRLGVRTLGAGCRSNVQVMFADNPQALLDRVAAEHEPLLGYWHHRDRDKLKAVTHPIQAWYVTGTGGDGGNVVASSFALGPRVSVGATGHEPHGFQIDDEDNKGWGPTGCGDKSRFTACLTSEFQSVLVVVDTRKTRGEPADAVGDYVAMLALAQPRSPDNCNTLPSVTDLFATDCPLGAARSGLTRADLAYLTALYRIDLQSRKPAQQKDIADRMAEMLIKGGALDRLAAQEPAIGTARR